MLGTHLFENHFVSHSLSVSRNPACADFASGPGEIREGVGGTIQADHFLPSAPAEAEQQRKAQGDKHLVSERFGEHTDS